MDPWDAEDRRRVLRGFSRRAETPRQLLVELAPDGTDYRVVRPPEPDAEEFAHNWQAAQLVLEDAAFKLTRAQLLERWPEDFPRPNDVTVWRLLKRAAAEGRVCCEGTGRPNEPFRYWLPTMEAVWQSVYGSQTETLPDALKAVLFRDAREYGDLKRPPRE